MKRQIEPEDLLPPDEYAKQRSALRKQIVEIKKRRRIEVGPYATFHFECFETMRAQIQEMLHIERGGDDQMREELAVYNPLVPKGKELVATLMFEIENPLRRAQELLSLGGIEHQIFLRIGDEEILAQAEKERTNEQGKTSAVHFLHFPFTEQQKQKFLKRSDKVILGFHHRSYGHMVALPEAVREELAQDL